MDSEEIRDYVQAQSTQQEQIIDILMVLLAHFSPKDAEFVDWVHNKKGRFLSSTTQAELSALQQEWMQRDQNSI
ncbi:hypothetical protein SEA_NICEHOUSE_29 [Rhodococcus phage NiceHouse]|nr:hypothetical protein SEA_NICEHOUSE_29 [Rhodococcus phage NiceHouse]